MKIMDNSPIDEPAIGRFVVSSDPVEQLEPNRLYLLPSASKELEDEVSRVYDGFVSTIQDKECINTYGFTALEEGIYTSQVEITRAIDEGCDLILQMNCPGRSDYLYLLTQTCKGDMYRILSLMIYTAERLTRHYLQMQVHDGMLKDAEQFRNLIEKAFSNPLFVNNLRINLASVMPGMSFGMGHVGAIGVGPVGAILGKLKKNDVDIHTKAKLLDRMTENITKVRKYHDKEADAELICLLRTTPPELLVEAFKMLSPSQLEKTVQTINPARYAESSQLRFEVCKPSDKQGYALPDNKRRKNDGEYLLFLNKGQLFEHVHFKHKSSFIVYLLYLCDRYAKKNQVDPIDMLDKASESRYMKLYSLVYPHDPDARKSYYTLTADHKAGSGEKRQKRLSDCYGEIRFAIGNACVKLDERAAPHVIENAGGHIYTMPASIEIPSCLLDAAQ